MIQIENHQDVALIRFDEGKVNALNPNSLTALKKAVNDCEQAKAVVLTGGQKCFSAGLDLKLMPTLQPAELKDFLELFNEVLQMILRHPRPFAAAVNGHAIAGGAVISLCCDYVLGVQEDLKIGLSEVPVGMPLPNLVIELARHRLSPRHLTEATLFGKMYSWEEALKVGYFNQAVPKEHLIPAALKGAEKMAQLPKEAFRITKERLSSQLSSEFGAEALESFATAGAQEHMKKFKS